MNKSQGFKPHLILQKRVDRFWYGEQEALDDYAHTWLHLDSMNPMELSELRLQAATMLASQSRDNFADHYMISTYGDGKVAVISVAGTMMNHPLPLRLFGMNVTTYGEIQSALQAVLDDRNVEQIVMAYATGGGSGNGLFRTSNMLARAAKIKPVTTFTDTVMASAGYWLGAEGSRIIAEPLAEVGSIGVYATMVSRSKMLEDIGVEAKIIRAGEFKALGHELEPISEKAVKEWQDGVDKAYDAFLEHASSKRGISKEVFRVQAAEGRMFTGPEAKRVGLVDDIMVFDDYIDSLLSSNTGAVSVSGSGQVRKLKVSGEVNMNELLRKMLEDAGVTLDEAQLAALQSGASFSSLEGLDPELAAKLDAAAAEEEGEGEGEGEGEEEGDGQGGDGDGEGDAGKGEGKDGEGKDSKLNANADSKGMMELVDRIASLSSDLSEARLNLSKANLELKDVKAKAELAFADIELMKPIIADRINAMNVGMRKGTVDGLKDLPVDKLLATYTETASNFEATFPVGQKSKSASTTKVKGESRMPEAWHESAKNATTI